MRDGRYMLVRAGISPVRAVVVGLATVLALGLAIALAVGAISGSARFVAFVAECVLITIVVAAMPGGLRARLALPVGAFVAAAGALSVFLPSNDNSSPSRPVTKPVNVAYLADLVRKGPFTEPLPAPLKAGALAKVGLGAVSAASRVDATQLTIVPSGGVQGFAAVEIYRTPRATAARLAAARRELVVRYGADKVHGNCADVPPSAWTCIGAHGYAFAEATVTPSSNANLPLATGTVAALLRYTDRMAKQAT